MEQQQFPDPWVRWMVRQWEDGEPTVVAMQVQDGTISGWVTTAYVHLSRPPHHSDYTAIGLATMAAIS